MSLEPRGRNPLDLEPVVVAGRRLPHGLVFAPMSGVSNLPARLLAGQAGAALTFSETVSARALALGRPAALSKLATCPQEGPFAVQLFGAVPEDLAAGCRMLADRGVDWVDLNLGCPVRKFLRQGAGAAMLRQPERVATAVRAMRRAFPGTLSVKLRSGWDALSRNAPLVARLAVDEGAELVTVHGRTRAQQYRGHSDPGIIREVVEAVPEVPVLANGDVRQPLDVRRLLEATGAAGVMIGRGAVGNPWIFRDTLAAGRSPAAPPSGAERLAVLERHVSWLMRGEDGPERRLAQVKRYAAAYSKGVAGGARFRERALEASSEEEVVRLARDFLVEAA